MSCALHRPSALAIALAAVLIPACSCSDTATSGPAPGTGDSGPGPGSDAQPPAPAAPYDVLSTAVASVGRTRNIEAGVPPMCYTATGGESNPCWVCHTVPTGKNFQSDWELQLEYSFSDTALTNHWDNLFVDRSAFLASVSEAEILAYVRQDNYDPLRRSLTQVADYPGYRPDVDLSAGFDDGGFARDGSGWRAVRFHPFLGSFWPTNGSTDDVFIRLPERFRVDAQGQSSRAVYQLNLALLEAAIAGPLAIAVTATPAERERLDLDRGRQVEPVDERLIQLDLDGDGTVGAGATRIIRLPDYYAGGAHGDLLRPSLYPQGTEFLHSVRYIDPEAPGLMAQRMKELRYSKKVEALDDWAITHAYERDVDDKLEGLPPVYRGSPLVGLRNAFGWQLQGFIEDAQGRLRLQTEEEHRFCMGCHSAIGVTVDHTFAFARKVPGAAGWRVQDLRGLQDRPQSGHDDPEILTYFRRVDGADEIRANAEMLSRFFAGGQLDQAAVARAAAGGDRDLAWLLAPSRARALALDKAYLAVVREQSFTRGRDAVLAPAERVHKTIENGATDLERTGKVFPDGRLHLVWE